jgi:hypothetical protein
MQMDSVIVVLAVLLWLLLLAVALQQGRPVGAGGQVATWLVLTALTLACGFLLAFVAVHALLFALGREAALAGLIASGLFLAYVPVACGRVIRHRGRHSSARG